MKQLFYVDYDDFNINGRSHELVKIANAVGSFSGVTIGNTESAISADHMLMNSGTSYMRYIRCVLKQAKKKKIDILFVTNRKATIPALLIVLLKRPKFIVYDMYELYLKNELDYLSGKIGCMFEKKLIRKANIVSCANEERAKIVKDIYRTKARVISYENIYKLEYSETVSFESIEEKYASYFTNIDSFKIISTSGFSIQRGNKKLIEDSIKVKRPIEIYLVGGGTEEEKQQLMEVINSNKLENIHLLGFVNHDELKYLISQCDCGVVNYGKQDTNNLYCASGKVYEFLFEGKPIVATDNPPLVNICNREKIGYASDDYFIAINHVIDNYEIYCNNVEKYIDLMDINSYGKKYIDTINMEFADTTK